VTFEFPALVPEERTYTSGQYKADRRNDLSGAAVRFLRSRIAAAHRLELDFSLGSEAEVRQILDHYRLAQSSFLPFSLRPTTWCGTDFDAPGTWRFLEPPQVADLSYGRFSVKVVLISVTSTLPPRALSPVEAGATVAIEAETPPAPPADPFGTFFRGYVPELEVGSDGRLAVTARAFPFSGGIVEVRVDAGFGRFPELSGDAAIVELLAPVGELTLPGQAGYSLLYDQNLPGSVFFDLERAPLEGGVTPAYALVDQPAMTHLVDGATVDASSSFAFLEGPSEPTWVEGVPELVIHLVEGQTSSFASSLTVVESASTPAFVDLTP
jgi:hypothetical protein